MDEVVNHYIVVDQFSEDAPALRTFFEHRVSDRSEPFDPARFTWEYWHVPGQFSQQRTPARGFFPEALLTRFERRLLAWAASNLGLRSFGSPPWLSYLVDGGFQGLHRDTPNGEFAFSFALTRPGPPPFFGGETLLARRELLDYWRRGAHRADATETPLFDEVPSRFNRLVAFDSRLPHGVRRVEGPRLPRDARLAIQGWLRADGCLVLEGALDAERATIAVGEELAEMRPLSGVEGLLSLRLDVEGDGTVKDVAPLANTLVATGSDDDAPLRAARALVDQLMKLRLPGAERPSRVVAPILVVEDGLAGVPCTATAGDIEPAPQLSWQGP